jgi:hypothetical protein
VRAVWRALGALSVAVIVGAAAVVVWAFLGPVEDGPVPAVADPYEVYLELQPPRPADWEGEWPLSREDAQTRALLGCGRQWAPGTIDGALAQAYSDAPCPDALSRGGTVPKPD